MRVQEEKILTLWKEFKKCYKNEAVAQSMLAKNTAVILPQLNSPAKSEPARLGSPTRPKYHSQCPVAAQSRAHTRSSRSDWATPRRRRSLR